MVATKAESLRKVDEETTTVRVYSDGKIGVAGQVGKADVASVEKSAQDNLALNIEYPCEFTQNAKKAVDSRKNIVDTARFVKTVQNLLAKLEKAAPTFLFSNKITYRENQTEYSNSDDTLLSHAGNELDVVLCVKSKTSANIMDFAYAIDIVDYDEDKVVADVKALCDAYDNPVDWQDGKYVVVTTLRRCTETRSATSRASCTQAARHCSKTASAKKYSTKTSLSNSIPKISTTFASSTRKAL